MVTTQLIDDADALKAFAARARTAPWLGLDTEFVRDRSYFPRAGLIQIATSEEIALIDPIRLASLAPLEPLLFGSAGEKIFHAGRQDLELFVVLFDRVPKPLFDTQTAAALLGLGDQLGYAALAESLLDAPPGLALGRYDWLKRPLSETAIAYAADDVAHLGAMRAMLATRIAESGRGAEFNDAMQANADPARYRPDPDRAWRRIRAARKLDGAARDRLKPLAAWRERQAMREDRPRQWVLRDRALVLLARRAPANPAELAEMRLVNPRDRRRYGEALLKLIAGSENQSKGSDLDSDSGSGGDV
jgi:ribonuclease D